MMVFGLLSHNFLCETVRMTICDAALWLKMGHAGERPSQSSSLPCHSVNSDSVNSEILSRKLRAG